MIHLQCPPHSWFVFIILLLLASATTGCSGLFDMVTESKENGDRFQGITYYVGGAGPIGHIGSLDVPNGLRDAGYDGYFQVYNWQSWTHAGDQINISRNREKAAELANMIRRYRRRYPRGEINIVALSAGAGIATFALEFLPEDVGVNYIVFLSCSMSSQYDLTRMLKRVKGRAYVVYSPTDRVLNNVVWYTGTVDRTDASEGVAGIEGFNQPTRGTADTKIQYRKLCNVVYRPEFADYDYRGGHTDSTNREFIRFYVARALMGDDSALTGRYEKGKRRPPAFPKLSPSTTQPPSKPSSIAHGDDPTLEHSDRNEEKNSTKARPTSQPLRSSSHANRSSEQSNTSPKRALRSSTSAGKDKSSALNKVEN